MVIVLSRNDIRHFGKNFGTQLQNRYQLFLERYLQ